MDDVSDTLDLVTKVVALGVVLVISYGTTSTNAMTAGTKLAEF